MRTLLLMLLATGAAAEQTTQPRDKAEILYQSIIATGSKAELRCDGGDECIVTWTPKEGAVVTVTDFKAQRAALVVELSALEDKLDAGTITQAETRRLIKIILKLSRMSRTNQ